MFDFDDLRTLQAGLTDLEQRSGTSAVAMAEQLNIDAELARARARSAIKHAQEIYESKKPRE